MARTIFHRNIQAGDRLEVFLVSGATSLLAVRFYLHVTNYPQLGGVHLHIAHMLYGGLLMVGAILLSLSYLGTRIQKFIAIIGGVGFGIFIDELGKFITRDNNYFYEPTVGLIYALFIILYLIIRILGRIRPLTQSDYLLNALAELEEAVIGDLDWREKRHIELLLTQAGDSPMTRQLLAVTRETATISAHSGWWWQRLRGYLSDQYQRLATRRHSSRIIGWLFLGESIILFISIALVLTTTVRHAFSPGTGSPTYDFRLGLAELISAAVAAIMTVIGLIKLPTSRMIAYEWFLRATLVNLLLTEFFMFTRIQFAALPSFAVNLVLYILLRYASRQEHINSSDRELNG